MPELYIVEGPGGIGDVWQCPNCSRMYPMIDDKGERIEPPRICRRCGSPMDATAGLKFIDQQAAEAATPTLTRRLVKV